MTISVILQIKLVLLLHTYLSHCFDSPQPGVCGHGADNVILPDQLGKSGATVSV